MRASIPHGSTLAAVLRYFESPLADQAFRNLMAMSSEDFEKFSDEFNSRTGTLGRKIGKTVKEKN